MPTRDAIPIEIIAAVNKTLNLLDLIDEYASSKFQLMFEIKFSNLFKSAVYANLYKKL